EQRFPKPKVTGSSPVGTATSCVIACSPLMDAVPMKGRRCEESKHVCFNRLFSRRPSTGESSPLGAQGRHAISGKGKRHLLDGEACDKLCTAAFSLYARPSRA